MVKLDVAGLYERYPALADNVSALQALQQQGAMSVNLNAFMDRNLWEIYDEEAVNAAHAAELLRRQGGVEEVTSYIQQQISDQLQGFIGTKFSDTATTIAICSAIEAQMKRHQRAREIASYHIHSKSPNIIDVRYRTAVDMKDYKMTFKLK